MIHKLLSIAFNHKVNYKDHHNEIKCEVFPNKIFCLSKYLLTSSAESAMKKPLVLKSTLTSGPGLMAISGFAPSMFLTSNAISNRFSFTKHILNALLFKWKLLFH